MGLMKRRALRRAFRDADFHPPAYTEDAPLCIVDKETKQAAAPPHTDGEVRRVAAGCLFQVVLAIVLLLLVFLCR